MDKQDLKNIIDGFATAGKVFSNEQDFQFELANALVNTNGFKEAKLEALTLDKNINIQNIIANNLNLPRDRKEYTDILVRDAKDKWYAIELKYKTTEKICMYTTQLGNMITLKQGAYYIGAYDFIKDISRLENVNNRNFLNGIKIEKSFAIILTNDKNYRYNNFSKSSIWQNYSIAETKPNRVIPKGTLYFRQNNLVYQTNSSKFQAITLKNQYNIQWNNYAIKNNNGTLYDDYQDKNKSSCPGFSYLIITV